MKDIAYAGFSHEMRHWLALAAVGGGADGWTSSDGRMSVRATAPAPFSPFPADWLLTGFWWDGRSIVELNVQDVSLDISMLIRLVEREERPWFQTEFRFTDRGAYWCIGCWLDGSDIQSVFGLYGQGDSTFVSPHRDGDVITLKFEGSQWTYDLRRWVTTARVMRDTLNQHIKPKRSGRGRR